MTEYRSDGRVSLQVLSHTRAAIARDCPAKWAYRYVDGLRARVESDPTRLRGRGMHEGLEAGYRNWAYAREMQVPLERSREGIRDAALAACFAAHMETLDQLREARDGGAAVEQCDEVLGKLEAAYEADSWALGHFFDVVVLRDYARKVPMLIEHEFNVPLVDTRGAARHLRWHGFLDCVMYDEKLRVLELHEQKTVGTNAGSDEHLRRIEGDPQTTSYIYALLELQKRGGLDAAMVSIGVLSAREVPIGTVVVNVIRRKKPSEPKTLADGTISTDRRIDTLPAVYEEALEGQGLPEALTKAEDALIHAMSTLEAARGDVTADVGGLEKKLDRAYAAVEKKRVAWAVTQTKQADLLERLRMRGDTFLAEHEQFVTERECERWRAEQWIEAERMRRIEKRPAERTRNLAYCTSPGRGCTYRTLCYSGGDEQIRATEFTTLEEREKMAAVEKEAAPVDEPTYSAPTWG